MQRHEETRVFWGMGIRGQGHERAGVKEAETDSRLVRDSDTRTVTRGRDEHD